MRLFEADGFATAMVEYPKGSNERFAFVIENEEADIKLYFFLTKENVTEILESITSMIGYDA